MTRIARLVLGIVVPPFVVFTMLQAVDMALWEMAVAASSAATATKCSRLGESSSIISATT